MTGPSQLQTSLVEARSIDAADPLAKLRDRFHLPPGPDGRPQIYFVGNSLGLPPIMTKAAVCSELDRWAELGVAGHLTGETAWTAYHQLLTEQMSMIVGGREEEVVVMNSLTVNLHLLLISFYDPTPERNKILIEAGAFPSDHFAVESQIRQRGFDPANSLELITPRAGEETIRPDDLLATIERLGDELALILLPGIHYYTGQVMPMADITRAGHQIGAMVGFDLAHAVGNIVLDLHDWGVDFAAWCTYKYLNSGPGGVGGAFVNNRHIADPNRQKLLGWWGGKADTRFEMATTFDPIPTVESWQLSNAPILAMAALRASLDVFDEAGGMTALRAKAERQIQYLDKLLATVLAGRIESITPKPLAERGCQFALRVTVPGLDGPDVYHQLIERGVACDWREPDVIRVAPVPLYNSFEDINRFVTILDEILSPAP
ncbi:MAG: kynureninase [Actinomycetia bacterium]|nr:kynureninase [Actinomycetes bacterium]